MAIIYRMRPGCGVVVTKLIRKAGEGSTKGSMCNLRSALSVYYADNEQFYPRDSLDSLVDKYIPFIPVAKLPPYHAELNGVRAETSPTEGGGWSYDNVDSSLLWGRLSVGCLHTDAAGSIWSTL